MYKVKINDTYKTMTEGQLRSFYIKLCNDKMQEFIDKANDWSKWYFRYDDYYKTDTNTIIRILEEENYKVKVVE